MTDRPGMGRAMRAFEGRHMSNAPHPRLVVRAAA